MRRFDTQAPRRRRYLIQIFSVLFLASSFTSVANARILGGSGGSSGGLFSSTAVQSGHAFPKAHIEVKPEISAKEPVLLEASEVDYDQENSIVIANGRVAVTQGDTVLLADTLYYDQVNDVMRAKGHVSMLEPSGNVYFAEEVELQNDMKAGVVDQFKARLSDNSLFVAARAKKIDDNTTELFKAVYTPCQVCATKSPLWEIDADHITINQAKQKVYYKNAFLGIKEVPVFYTPYLSHPTPGADNQSGLLIPEYAHSDNLGSVYKVPVYLALADDKDATITPIYTSNEGLVMAGEYRQRFNDGQLMMDGSITQPQDRDPGGNLTSGKQFRGHINAVGAFNISPDYDWGLDIHRTTDDTYLRRYGFSEDTLLTSRVYGEGFNFMNNRSYAVVEGLSFQGLTAQDNADTIPFVLPLMDVRLETDPGIYNSRFTFDGNAMALARDVGAQSRRISATAGWKLPYITDDGQMIEFEADLRGDMYSVEDVLLSDGRLFTGVTGRLVPLASATWQYPFINRWGNSSMLIAPIANISVSPGGGNPEKIPNEDSLVPEFTDTNLFDANRFAGYDRVENGPRASYGLRGQAQFLSDKYLDWMIGQHYRMENDRNFPFSNDLVSHFSDYVGKIGLDWQPFALAYRFRLDKDDFAPKRSEIDANFNYYPLTFGASYLSLKNDPILATREQVAANANLNLTKEWRLSFDGNRDLLLNQLVSTNWGLTYQDECTNIATVMGRQYTRDRDVKPSTTFLFRVSLKNLE